MESGLISKKVVVIDSGIKRSHVLFKNRKIDGIAIQIIDDKVQITQDIEDRHGHGTAICGIISKIVEDAEIFVIKIFHEELVTDADLLIYALEYVNENIDCVAINMSNGLKVSDSRLEQICNKLEKKNVLLISAFDNDGAVSFPSAYDSVIGVDQSVYCRNISDFIYIEQGIINVLAKGGTHRVAWINPEYMLVQGVSFSAAYVTSFLMKNYKDIKGRDIALQLIKNKSIKQYNNIRTNSDIEMKNIPFTISKAAVVPYNKEIHSLVNFSELLPFEIDGIYTSGYFGNIGEKVTGLISQTKFILDDIKNINWDRIDTLIIGHLQELEIISQKNIKEDLIKKCLEHGVNVYTFDNELVAEYIKHFVDREIYIFCPIKSCASEKKLGKLYTFNTPVLGIFGTSSSQGKFTLQLQLRKYFLENGYTIGQLGTEPSALLFEMDEVYPYGYASTVQLKDEDYVEKVNEIMFQIDNLHKDIIIVGGQSGTVPRHNFNLIHLHIPQLLFLLGTNPDYVILVVNLFDEISYIKRTKEVIENIVECSVIAFAISPLVFGSEWNMLNNKKIHADEEELVEFKELLKVNFNLPSFIVGNPSEIYSLYHRTISVLSEEDGE